MRRLLTTLWPVRRSEVALFSLMLVVTTLHGVIYTIIRSAKSAFVVSTAGAKAIPFIQLFVLLPLAIGAAWFVASLLRRYSHERVFGLIAAGFIILFASFGLWLYPYRAVPAVYSLFWSAAELWKVVLLSVLLRGLLNTRIEYGMAKRLYAPIGLSIGLSAVLAGPLTMACNSPLLYLRMPLSDDPWQHSMMLMMGIVVVLGILMLASFHVLVRYLPMSRVEASQEEGPSIALGSSLRFLFRSSYLKAMLLMVICDYLAYSLAELLFLDILSKAYPDPSSYCHFMGKLTTWGGVANLATVLFVAPVLIQKCRWVVPAMVTPVVVIVTSTCFIGAIFFDSIPLAVVFGSVLFCYCRAAKYGLFDPTKELAYVPLAREAQLRGKLVIDGIAARFGRGGSAAMAMGLTAACGTVIATTPYVGLIILAAGGVWVGATRRLGQLVHQNVAGIREEEAAAGGEDGLSVGLQESQDTSLAG